MARLGVLALACGLVVVGAPPATADAGDITVISELPDGSDPPGPVFVHDISGDGDTTLFQAQGTSGGYYGLFTHTDGVTTRIDDAVGDFGTCCLMGRSAMSDDGRYVGFLSTSDHFPGPSNGALTDLYTYDRELLTFTYLATTGTTNFEQPCGQLDVANGGGVVAFGSTSSLVPEDTNTWCDAYVWDADTGLTLATPSASTSLSSPYLEGSRPITLTPDGRYLLLTSDDNGLVGDSTDVSPDLFLRDLSTGTTTLESLSETGQPLPKGAFSGDVTDDASEVVFASESDPTGEWEPSFFTTVYVRDRATNDATRVATRRDGSFLVPAREPLISGDGRFVVMDFDWTWYRSLPGQDQYNQVAVVDRTTGEAQLVTHGADPETPIDAFNSQGLIAGDGSAVVWNSTPPNASDMTGYRYEVRGLAPVDADGDAIADVVDADGGDGSLPGQFQDAFVEGTIGAMPPGWFVAITDAPAPDGVRAVVNGSGPGKANISVCGFPLKLSAGADAVLTCGSVIAKVAAGTVEVVLDDGASIVVIPAGSETEVGDAPGGDGFVVDVLSGAPASIVTAEGTTIVEEDDDPTTTPGDTVPPVVTGTPDRAPNAAGWYTGPVTITWTAIDPPPSSGGPTTPAPTTVSTFGANQLITSGQSCDTRGNCATGTVVLNIDGDRPVARIAERPILLGTLGARISGTAVDGTSGISEVTVVLRSGPFVRRFSTTAGTVRVLCEPSRRLCGWVVTVAPIGLWRIDATVTDAAGRTGDATSAALIL